MQTILLAMAEWNTEYEDKGLELRATIGSLKNSFGTNYQKEHIYTVDVKSVKFTTEGFC